MVPFRSPSAVAKLRILFLVFAASVVFAWQQGMLILPDGSDVLGEVLRPGTCGNYRTDPGEICDPTVTYLVPPCPGRQSCTWNCTCPGASSASSRSGAYASSVASVAPQTIAHTVQIGAYIATIESMLRGYNGSFGDVQYILDPPTRDNINLPYWGAMMKFPVIVSNMGPDDMTEADRYSFRLTPHFPEGYAANAFVFDHIASGTGCSAVLQECFAVEPIAGCAVQGTQVTCPIPLLPNGQSRLVDLYFKTTPPDPCAHHEYGPGGNGFRSDFELINDGLGYTPTLDYVETPLQCVYCGDGYANPATYEVCDDGNRASGDGCSNTCQIEPGSECFKKPYLSAAGEAEWMCWRCGDGVLGPSFTDCRQVPTLDWGFAVGDSRQVCTTNGEECDDGNQTNGDGCTALCKREICGDGVVNNGEQCDIGKRCDDIIFCDTRTCKMGEACRNLPYVGGGTRLQCTNDRRCYTDVDCAFSHCEARDVNGCTASCSARPGWTCTGSPSTCVFTSCGNGVLDAGTEEICDDGNKTAGDGCSPLCVVETDWICDNTPMPSVCEPWDACTDSDGGKDFVTAGRGDGATRVAGLDRHESIIDRCLSDKTLLEVFCSQPRGLPATMTYICPYKCLGGICLTAPSGASSFSSVAPFDNACTDSDGGKNYAVSGITRGGSRASSGLETVQGYTDYCESATRLVESFCPASTGLPLTETVTCPGFCASGACRSSASSSAGAQSSAGSQTGGFCANRLIEIGEQCDDGNRLAGDGCSQTCQRESGWICEGVPSVCGTLCGDSIRAGVEQCDDGNLVSGDGCSSACRTEQSLSSAASSFVIGMLSSSSRSSSVSVLPRCGNGLLEGSEQCDTNHPCPGGGFCTASCSCTPRSSSRGSAPSSATMAVAGIALCSNGVLEAGEQCEVGVTGCPSGYACHPSQCECVPVASSSPSSVSSQASLCGNSMLDAGEQCEVGAPCPAGRYCTYLCQCILLPGAAAHSSSLSSESALLVALSSASSSSLSSSFSSSVPSMPVVCGDGVLDPGEQCERGLPCQSGFFFCAADCLCTPMPTVAGAALSPASSAASTLCGNGLLESGEQCDDGNIMYGDGCSTFCILEHPAAPPAPVCGDGITDDPEQCDDGNGTDGDGCSSLCTSEEPTSSSSSSSSSSEESSSLSSSSAEILPVLPAYPSAPAEQQAADRSVPWVWIGILTLVVLLLTFAMMFWRAFQSRQVDG